MHSNLVQISGRPIPEERYITPYSEEVGGEIFRVADYLADESPERAGEDLKCIFDGEAFRFDPEKKTVQVVDKNLYFSRSFAAWQKHCKQLLDTVSLDKFSDRYMDILMWDLDSEYRCVDGIWMRLDDGEIEPMDDWMRSVKDGETYYIGAVLDYHA